MGNLLRFKRTLETKNIRDLDRAVVVEMLMTFGWLEDKLNLLVQNGLFRLVDKTFRV
jgi:hypothetical protein